MAVVPILLFANIFLGIYYNVSIWYKLSDQTKKGAQISIFGAIITIVLNLILIPRIGYMGCAWTTFICYLFMMVLGYVWGQKYYPIPYNLNRAFVYLTVALGLYMLVQYSANFVEVDTIIGFALRALLLLAFMVLAYLLEMKKVTFFKTTK